MKLRLNVPMASWPMADQAVISLGTFIFNIVLARNVPLSEYGAFAMLIGVASLFQTIIASLIFYPLSVRNAVASGDEGKRLILTGLALTAFLAVPFAAVLAGLTGAFIDSGLAVPALAFFMAGQCQEALRRGLLAEFRYRAAILGDGISYGGQGILLLILAGSGVVGVSTALFVMAGTSLLAACVQFEQIALRGARPLPVLHVAGDFWRLGKWSLASNVLGVARSQVFPWILAATAGPAAPGAFQAALNILNTTNPILTGICNIIPQAAARALSAGHRAAWAAAWPLIRFGIAPILLISVALTAAPATFVALIYGNDAEYLQIVPVVRVLGCTVLFNYAAAAGCSYLYGVGVGRSALLADVVSTVAVLSLAVPLTVGFGLVGSCVALASGGLIRTAVIAGSVANLFASRRLELPLAGSERA